MTHLLNKTLSRRRVLLIRTELFLAKITQPLANFLMNETKSRRFITKIAKIVAKIISCVLETLLIVENSDRIWPNLLIHRWKFHLKMEIHALLSRNEFWKQFLIIFSFSNRILIIFSPFLGIFKLIYWKLCPKIVNPLSNL